MGDGMEVVIAGDGVCRCIYDEAIPLADLGTPIITRASHVEPTGDGQWTADLSPVGGPLLGPFGRRSQALKAEVGWLRESWLVTARLRGISTPSHAAAEAVFSA